MTKKVLALFLALCMIFSLCACGAKQEDQVSEPVSESDQGGAPESGLLPITRFTEFGDLEDGFTSIDEKDTIYFDEMRNQFGDIPKTEPVRIAMVFKSLEVEFWQVMKKSFEEFEADAKAQGYDLTIEIYAGPSDNDAEGQLVVLRDVVRSKPDLILLTPITDSNCNPAIEEAHEAGIPVLGIISEFQGNDGFICPNPLDCGALCAETLAEALDYKGDIGVVVGQPTSVVTLFRTKGFEDWMQANAPDINVVEKQNADFDAIKAKDITSAWLLKHPDLDGIYTNADCMSYGISDAIEEAGLSATEDIVLVSQDGEPAGVQNVKDGRMTNTITIFPDLIAKMAAEVAVRKLAGQDIPRLVYTPCVALDLGNVDKSEADLIGYNFPVYN